MTDPFATCERWDEPISLLAAGCLPAEEEADVRRHLAHCAACAARAAELTAVCASLHRSRPSAAVPTAAICERWNAAAEVLAANLASLSPQPLDSLAAVLKTLPATPSVADCIRFEGQMFGDWMERFINAEAAKLNEPKAGGKIVGAMVEQTGNDNWAGGNLESLTVAEVRESLRRLRADYAESAKIAALPPAERRGRRTEFEAQLAAARKSAKPADVLRTLSQLFLPAIGKAADREDQFQVRQQLLRLAIQALRHGPDAIKGAAVANHGPVEYRQTDAGFELRCQPGSADKPEVLQVGTAK